MQQPDLFDDTLEKKILRMEKWIMRLHRELWFLKQVYALKDETELRKSRVPPQQLNMFGT